MTARFFCLSLSGNTGWNFYEEGRFLADDCPVGSVNAGTMFGTSYLAQGEEDLYRTQDSEYLAGTAEVSAMGYHTDEIRTKNLPKKFYAFFAVLQEEKPEATGKMLRGLIRVHEFLSWSRLF